MTLRTAPRYSHESNGRVEGMNKTLAGIMRTIKSEFKKKRTSQLEWGKCLLPWLVRHCAWTLMGVKTLQDGHSTYFKTTGAEYR